MAFDFSMLASIGTSFASEAGSMMAEDQGQSQMSAQMNQMMQQAQQSYQQEDQQLMAGAPSAAVQLAQMEYTDLNGNQASFQPLPIDANATFSTDPLALEEAYALSNSYSANLLSNATQSDPSLASDPTTASVDPVSGSSSAAQASANTDHTYDPGAIAGNDSDNSDNSNNNNNNNYA